MQPHPLRIKDMIILLFLFAVALTVGQVFFTTVPDTDSGPAYVYADEGTLNVSLYCYVISNNIQVQSTWFVKKQTDEGAFITSFNITGELISPADLIGKITAIGDIVQELGLTYQTNFTILNFTSEFNLAQVQCGPGPIREFNFGFPGRALTLCFILVISKSVYLVLPSLLTLASTQLVVENNNITVNLTVEGAPIPFPPVLISQWTHEGQPLLSNGNDIILTDYTITLGSVQRNQSGNYTLIVSNNAGSTTTNFIIDVQCK